MIVAGNWKMNLNINEAIELSNELLKHNEIFVEEKIIIFPSFLIIPEIYNLYKNSKISIGAQDCSMFDNGAFTGQVSAKMIKDTGCKYVIVGHSERRSLCHETSSIVSQKAFKAISAGLKVIICIGENLKDRENGDYLLVLEDQLKKSLSDISSDSNLISNAIIIAYEPVWAIGTGNTASKQDIEEVHKFIKEIISSSYQFNYDLPILYGGSVNSKNSSEIFKINNVDGVLVGGASLNSDEFLKIINNSMKLFM